MYGPIFDFPHLFPTPSKPLLRKQLHADGYTQLVAKTSTFSVRTCIYPRVWTHRHDMHSAIGGCLIISTGEFINLTNSKWYCREIP